MLDIQRVLITNSMLAISIDIRVLLGLRVDYWQVDWLFTSVDGLVEFNGTMMRTLRLNV